MKKPSFRLTNYVPLALAFAVLAGMAWEVSMRPTPADAEPFHTAAAAAIKDLPARFGPWESIEVPVPAAARTLLKPNALVCRAFTNKQTGERASLVLVQCRDSRDMAGHYPPICYPAQGWNPVGDPKPVPIPLKELQVTAVRYEFTQAGFDHERRLVVYDFFAIPGDGLPIDMKAVRAAAADYTARPFGATQVQVVFDGRPSFDEERAIAAEILNPLEQVLQLLSDASWRSR